MREPFWSEEVLGYLTRLLKLVPNAPLYLVGGVIRDRFLDRAGVDYDLLVLGENAFRIGRWFSRKTKGVFVPLDREEDTVRMVYPSFFLIWWGEPKWG